MRYTKQYQNRGNKYKAKRQTFGGRSYHSKKEAAYAEQLELRKLAGEIKHIKPQHKLPPVSYTHLTLPTILLV